MKAEPSQLIPRKPIENLELLLVRFWAYQTLFRLTCLWFVVCPNLARLHVLCLCTNQIRTFWSVL